MSGERRGRHRADTRPAWAPRRRHAANLLVVICLGVIAAGALLILNHASSSAQAGQTSAAPVPARPFAVSPQETARSPSGEPSARPAVGDTIDADPGCELTMRPDHIVIPDLCIAAPVTEAEISAGGELVLAAGVGQVDRWVGGAAIGGDAGTVLIAGHVSYNGDAGPFQELHRAQPGQLVYVSHGQTVTAWRVFRLAAVGKEDLPPRIFRGPKGPRRLVLVTCAGTPEHRPGLGYVYPENTVVEAVQVG